MLENASQGITSDFKASQVFLERPIVGVPHCSVSLGLITAPARCDYTFTHDGMLTMVYSQ